MTWLRAEGSLCGLPFREMGILNLSALGACWCIGRVGHNQNVSALGVLVDSDAEYLVKFW